MAELFNQVTNRRGLIVFGGEASSDYGMVVAEAPAFERSTRKSTSYNVPGRNGVVLFQEDAWEDKARPYKVWLTAEGKEDLAASVNAIEAWLNSVKGYQRLEDNFEPDVFRLAYFNGGADFSNELTQYGEATLSFMCRAERFYKEGELPVTVSNGTKLLNSTRFTSKPLIHIEGSGTVNLAINGEQITASLTDYINIDVERMNAYRLAGQNLNSSVSGTFPKIAPGENTIITSGTITKATIVPRYFTI